MEGLDFKLKALLLHEALQLRSDILHHWTTSRTQPSLCSFGGGEGARGVGEGVDEQPAKVRKGHLTFTLQPQQHSVVCRNSSRVNDTERSLDKS